MPEDVNTYRSLHQYFMATLEKVARRVTRHRALILLLDGLDHFRPAVAARSLSWLPESWPQHVHVVLTTDTADELSMRNLGNHISRIIRSQKLDKCLVDECFLAVDPLDADEQLRMVDSLRQNSQRASTAAQHEVNVAVFLPTCSYRDNF